MGLNLVISGLTPIFDLLLTNKKIKMKVKRFVSLGLEQWFDKPHFSYLPIELFKTNNIPQGFRVGKISEIYVRASKSSFGGVPVFKTPDEALSWAKAQLEAKGERGKFAFSNAGNWIFFEI